jgi:ectoine hydroxylase-related dioxygenase (phytanoyl-CoA dioxygenase family)
MVVHTDQLVIPFQTPIPVVSNAMVCLSEFREDMGSTRVLPGSHRMEAPKMAIDWEAMDAYNPDAIGGMVSIECPPGAAILFEGRLWHSSGWSTAEDVRYSISTYFAAPFVRAQDAYIASLSDEAYAQMSNEERAMVGFKTQSVGRIDPRFPGDRTNVDMKNPFIPELRRGSDRRALPTDPGEAPFASVSSRDRGRDGL